MPFKIRLYVIDYNQELLLLLLCVTERSTGFFKYSLDLGHREYSSGRKVLSSYDFLSKQKFKSLDLI